MRFDDLQLLHFILKEEETPTGALYDGFRLIQAIVNGPIVDQNDYRLFANELRLARSSADQPMM